MENNIARTFAEWSVIRQIEARELAETWRNIGGPVRMLAVGMIEAGLRDVEQAYKSSEIGAKLDADGNLNLARARAERLVEADVKDLTMPTMEELIEVAKFAINDFDNVSGDDCVYHLGETRDRLIEIIARIDVFNIIHGRKSGVGE